jgi:gamma-glutamylcyclotransferase
MPRYAAYGSNLLPQRLGERVPAARLLGAGVLESHWLRFDKRSVDGSGKCNVVPAEGRVHVGIYELDDDDAAALDGFEGPGYVREWRRVPPFGDCFLYVARPTYIDPSLSPYTWYLALVLAGCEHLAFPQAYVDKLAAIESHRDPDDGRHARHMALVHRALAQQGGP